MAMADHFIGLGEPLKRLECLKEGFVLMKKLDFKKGMARIGMQTAFFYADIGDTTEAMNQLQKMQELEMQIGDSTRISRGYYILAKFYDEIKKYDLALINYKKAESRFKGTRDTAQLLQTYYELGNTYKNKGEYDEALKHYEICRAMAIQNGNNFQYIGAATIGIGDVYRLKKEFGKAIAMHKEIYDFYDKLNFETVIFYVGTHLANDYYLSGQYANAKPIINKLLSLASSSNYFPDLLECERLTYKIDSATGNYRSSLEHFQKYLTYKNKINTEAVQKASVQQKYQDDLAEQKEKAKKQQESLEAKSKEEKRKQDLILYAVSFVLFFIFIFAILLYRGYRLKQKANKELGVKNETIEAQKHEVEEKQKEILDSIKYAKRIQTALLPSEKYIARKLSGSQDPQDKP
jgi:tetratricopeptide (TPR) repeat protein